MSKDQAVLGRIFEYLGAAADMEADVARADYENARLARSVIDRAMELEPGRETSTVGEAARVAVY